MTTQSEKVRKLRALARDKGAFANEAAVALAKAQALESRTAKVIARAIAQLLKTRGLTVRVRRRSGEHWQPTPRVDATVQYHSSRSRHSNHQFEILITEYWPRQ
jgi:uncharacterized C2H2 Zn-finger protein